MTTRTSRRTIGGVRSVRRAADRGGTCRHRDWIIPGGKRGGLSFALVALVVSAGLSVMISALVPDAARSQEGATVSSYPRVVNPFFEVAVWKRSNPKRLVRLHVFGVTSGEDVTSACSACGGAHFRRKIGSDRVTLNVSRRLHMTPSTRIIVAATAPGEIGRWIVIDFRQGQYRGLHHGCMPPGVRSLRQLRRRSPRRFLSPSASTLSALRARSTCCGREPTASCGSSSTTAESGGSPSRWAQDGSDRLLPS